MKRLLPVVFILLAGYSYAFQTSGITTPPEETRPSNNWWWLIGVVLAIALGMVLYLLIKKNPRKDAAD
jgi:phosphotransferase system  glucose/maltose/N-acetylglucosamine-specific IIC component